MAKKQNGRGKDERGGALGDFAEQVGTLLGQAEARWRTWQGAETREAIADTVKSVRDRASALLKDIGVPLGQASRDRRPARPPRNATAAKSPRKTASRPGGTRKRAGKTAKGSKRAAASGRR